MFEIIRGVLAILVVFFGIMTLKDILKGDYELSWYEIFILYSLAFAFLNI